MNNVAVVHLYVHQVLAAVGEEHGCEVGVVVGIEIFELLKL